MSPPEELTIKNALDTLNSALLLEDSHQRGKYSPTLYGRLIASLPLSLESAILVVRGGQLGLLRETAILAALMDSSPLPIVHPFGHELQVSSIFLISIR
jgi:HrpA-like RNA helicase